MATVTKNQTERNDFNHTPYGNVVALRYTLKTNASGGAIDADSAAALDVADVVNVGILPAGLRIIDSQVVVKTAMTASVTGNLGFAYVDGVNDTSVSQDATYLGTALVLSAAARLRNVVAKTSVTLQKPAYLTLTVGGAKNVKASEVEITILAIAEGRK